MRFGGSSWRVSFGEPERLVIALYVRDATGLWAVADPLIPPLEPFVAVHESLHPGVDRIAASAQWGEWWAGLLLLGGEVGRVRLPEPRTELRELAGRPALQALAREVFPEASAWAAQRKRETATMMHGPEAGAVRTERRLIQEVTRRAGHQGAERVPVDLGAGVGTEEPPAVYHRDPERPRCRVGFAWRG